MKPLLSVVIANYNYGRFLPEAIESVLNQSCPDFELIIIDGASTDCSVEVIKRYSDHVAYWVSEKDRGQSNAFNKGFVKASGRFLTWLNADDVMLPGTIERLKMAVLAHPECEWFVGGAFWLDPQMRIVKMGRGRPFSEIRFRSGYVNGCGPSTFFTKCILESVGGVDERFHYLMDTDLWFRFAKAGVRYLPFCNYAWGLRLHPDAKMSAHNFTADGKLVLGPPTGRTEKERLHEERVDMEKAWMLEGFPVRRLTPVRRILSVSWCQVVAARIDLLRFRGRHYLEYFK